VFLLIMILFFNIIIVLINFLRAALYHKFLKLKGIVEQDCPLLTKQNMVILFFQKLILLAHPSIFFIGKKYTIFNMIIATDVYYFYNDFLNFLQLYKGYIIIRSFASRSFYSSNRAFRVW